MSSPIERKAVAGPLGAFLVTFIGDIITLLMSFGLEWTGTQVAAVLVVIQGLMVLAAVVFAYKAAHTNRWDLVARDLSPDPDIWVKKEAELRPNPPEPYDDASPVQP